MQQTAGDTPPAAPCALLRIPVELRLVIYRYRFGTLEENATRCIGDHWPSCRVCPLQESNHHRTALLQTCRQVWREGQAVLYESSAWAYVRWACRNGLVSRRSARYLDTLPMPQLDRIRALQLKAHYCELILFGVSLHRNKSHLVYHVVRTHLPSLRIVSAYADQPRYATFYNVICLLAQQQFRQSLGALYPALDDLRCIGTDGGERVRKRDGQWELAYSREKLPLAIWEQYDEDHLYFESGFMTEEMLRWVGPSPEPSSTRHHSWPLLPARV